MQKPPTVALFYALLFIYVVGMRPVSIAFGDTVNYARTYYNMSEVLDFSEFMGKDVFFYRFMFFCAHHMPIYYFFLIIEIVYIGTMALACWRLDRRNFPILLIVCMSAYSFFSYGVNGLRNGMACNMIILAMTYILGNTKDKLICAALCLAAVNIHHSAMLPVVAMVFVYFYRKPRMMFYFWIASILISLTAGGMVESFFAGMGFDDRLNDYISAQGDEDEMSQFSQTGFRWDFLLYSAMPVIMGWFVVFKRKIIDMNYMILLGTYIYSNAFWVMVIRSSFSNRFAYLSWFLYPLVLTYPLLRFPLWEKKQGRYTAYIIGGHLAFTIFMWSIGK
ncbi:MAG: EpsG family protein [Prevotella sp.]|nr:EpsG family protein [Prevotella sp.]